MNFAVSTEIVFIIFLTEWIFHKLTNHTILFVVCITYTGTIHQVSISDTGAISLFSISQCFTHFAVIRLSVIQTHGILKKGAIILYWFKFLIADTLFCIRCKGGVAHTRTGPIILQCRLKFAQRTGGVNFLGNTQRICVE